MRKYSPEFERDFQWYLSMRHQFNFDGSLGYCNKQGLDIIVPDKRGVSGKEAFYQWDSTGKITPTRHPNILFALLKTKGSANLHIKMYAEDRANGRLPMIEFSISECVKRYGLLWLKRLIATEGKVAVRQLINNDYEHQLHLPQWFINAVEQQKYKYYIWK